MLNKTFRFSVTWACFGALLPLACVSWFLLYIYLCIPLTHIDWAGSGFDDAFGILVSIFLDAFLIPTIPKLHFLFPFRSFEMHMVIKSAAFVNR